MKKKNKCKRLIMNLVVVLFSVIFIRLFIFEIYYISGDSMNDTLMHGDVVLINKLSYGGRIPSSIADIPWLNIFSLFLPNEKREQLEKKNPSNSRFVSFATIKRGDVIVINNPWHLSSYLVKRCIAIAGDSISINHNSDLLINGSITEEYPLVKKLYNIDYVKSGLSNIRTFSELVDSLRIPYHEDRLQKRSSVKNIYLTSHQKHILASKIGADLMEPDSCCGYYPTQIIPVLNSMPIEYSDKQACKACNYYFVMGDNRCFSTDSRHFGIVPENLIIGKIEFVFFSLSKNKELRKKRIFIRI